MNILQKLANRIYELLPHKKELEFGCEYRALGQTFVQLNGLRSTEKEMPQGLYLLDMFENDGIVTEIIGQPIRLDSIVEALLLIKATDEELLRVIKLWQPKNTFENQKEELYTKLGQLLLQ